MWTCAICHFETEFDDVELAIATGQCVCLRCYGRETGTTLQMPKSLRIDIISALEQPSAA
jgi:hypothetical protein